MREKHIRTSESLSRIAKQELGLGLRDKTMAQHIHHRSARDDGGLKVSKVVCVLFLGLCGYQDAPTNSDGE